MVFILYISTEKKGQANHQNTSKKQKIREKGAKHSVQVAGKKSKPQRHRASKNIEL